MGHTGFISVNAIRRRHYKKHIDGGLCPHCSRKSEEDRVLCEYHLEYQRNAYKKKNGSKSRQTT